MSKKIFFVLLLFFFVLSGLAQGESQFQGLLEEKNFTLNSSLEERSRALQELEFETGFKRKSTSKAFFLSLVLPGLGHYYAEDKNKAKYFGGTEATFWLGFLAFRTYGAWKKQDYKLFAAGHAGVNLDGKGDEFFEDLTFYDSRDEFNSLSRLYDGPTALIYPENSFWNWQWDSRESRTRYREIRNQSKNAYHRALYFVGLAGLNRIISSLSAVKAVKNYNQKKSLEQANLTWDLKTKFWGSNPGFKIQVTRHF